VPRRRDDDRDDLEEDVTQLIQPPGRTPLGEDLTPERPTARVAEDASAELGEVEPRDEPVDQAPDITPDQIERRSPPAEREVTARPDEWPPAHEED